MVSDWEQAGCVDQGALDGDGSGADLGGRFWQGYIAVLLIQNVTAMMGFVWTNSLMFCGKFVSTEGVEFDKKVAQRRWETHHDEEGIG